MAQEIKVLDRTLYAWSPQMVYQLKLDARCRTLVSKQKFQIFTEQHHQILSLFVNAQEVFVISTTGKIQLYRTESFQKALDYDFQHVAKIDQANKRKQATTFKILNVFYYQDDNYFISCLKDETHYLYIFNSAGKMRGYLLGHKVPILFITQMVKGIMVTVEGNNFVKSFPKPNLEAQEKSSFTSHIFRLQQTAR